MTVPVQPSKLCMPCDSRNCSCLLPTKAFSMSLTSSGRRYQTSRVMDTLSMLRFTRIDYLRCQRSELQQSQFHLQHFLHHRPTARNRLITSTYLYIVMVTQHCHLYRFDDRSFAVAGPHLWNSLPISLQQISSYGQFRRYLKSHLFGI